ncbi:MAG: DUF2442 domain-containing protein [Phycisphaerales bacterium]
MRDNTLRAIAVRVLKDFVQVDLEDGRRVSTPISFFPTLENASPKQRGTMKFLGGGAGVEWPLLDLLLSTQSIVEGRREHVPGRDWQEGAAARLTKFRDNLKSST